MDKDKTVSDRIDESYGYEEPQEEEESKSIAQQMLEAIKAKRDGVFRKGKKVM